MSDEFAGGLVDDTDVEVVNDENNLRSFERASEADVVHFPATSQGHGPGFVDAVVADPVVRCGPFIVWLVFGKPVVSDGRCDLADRGVDASVVVDVDELIDQCLQAVEGFRWGSGAQPFLHCLLEPFDAPMFVKRRGGGCSKLVVGWLWGGSCRSPGRCSA